MSPNMSDSKKAGIFTTLVLALSLLAALTVRAMEVTSETFTAVLIFMSTPTIAALFMMLVVTRDGWSRAGWRRLGLARSRRRTWPLAGGASLMVSLVASAAVWASPLADLHVPSDAIDEIINFAINVALMSFTLVLGEELGWRGYLLPCLRRAGRNRALVAVGLVHAAWHMPLIFLTPIYHSDGNKLLVMPLFTGTVIAASFVFGYLRLGTGSVWPAVLAHSVHNAAWALLGAFTVTSHPVIVEEYLAGDNGVLVLLTTILAAWWVRHRLVSREGLVRVAAPVPALSSGGGPTN